MDAVNSKFSAAARAAVSSQAESLAGRIRPKINAAELAALKDGKVTPEDKAIAQKLMQGYWTNMGGCLLQQALLRQEAVDAAKPGGARAAFEAPSKAGACVPLGDAG